MGFPQHLSELKSDIQVQRTGPERLRDVTKGLRDVTLGLRDVTLGFRDVTRLQTAISRPSGVRIEFRLKI